MSGTGSSGGGCDHIGLFTNGADRLVRFYGDVFGLQVVAEEILPASLVRAAFGAVGACRFVKLSPAPPPEGGGGAATVLEIFQPLRARLQRRRGGSVGCCHWGFRVGDRLRFAEGLGRRGVPVIEVRRHGRPVFFVRDPDGNRVELRD